MDNFKRKLFVVISLWFAAAAGQTASAYLLLSLQPLWSQDMFNPGDPYYYVFNIYGGLPPGNEHFEEAYKQSLDSWLQYGQFVLDYSEEYRPPAYTNPGGTFNCDSSIGFNNRDVTGNFLQPTTLAIAESLVECSVRHRSGTQSRTQFRYEATDITFNSGIEWSVYDGPEALSNYDFRRVALHEIGHLLGLGHPDEAGQSVVAIMNSQAGDLYTLQADDIVGLRTLYGHPPVQEVTASAGIGTDRIEVAWNSVLSASRYRVFRAAGISNDYNRIDTVAALSYTDSSLSPGNTYSYRIFACTDAAGETVCSDDSPVGVGYTRLSVPANVAASDDASTDYIEINWNVVDGAAHYQLYRSSAQQDIGSVIASPAAPGFDDSNVAPGVAYYYRVQACADFAQFGEQCFSVSSADVGSRQLLKPANVEAAEGDSTDYIRVSWDAVVGASNYFVSRSVGLTDAYEHIATVTAPTYDDAEAAAGQRFYYRIQACSDTCSDNSDAVAGWRSLPTPTNVTASQGGSADYIEIAWDDTADAQSYLIYRSAIQTDNFNAASIVADLVYRDAEATPGSTFYYRIRACPNDNGAGICGGLSDAAAGWRNLSTPTNVQASDGASTDRVVISWDYVWGAFDYHIQRSSTRPDGYSELAAVTSLSYDDEEDFGVHVPRYYRLQACAALGCSAYSSPVRGHRGLPAPTTVVASDGLPSTVHVTWTPVPDAEFYAVYRFASGSPFALVDGESSSYIDETVGIGRYHYTVRACTGSMSDPICGAFSDADAGATAEYLDVLRFYIRVFLEGAQ